MRKPAAALALLVILALTVGRNADAIAANFTGGHFWAGSPDFTPAATSRLTCCSAQIGSRPMTGNRTRATCSR